MFCGNRLSITTALDRIKDLDNKRLFPFHGYLLRVRSTAAMFWVAFFTTSAGRPPKAVQLAVDVIFAYYGSSS